jgi:NTP pyrophosphatase (non-canonical NTP hydrolase)
MFPDFDISCGDLHHTADYLYSILSPKSMDNSTNVHELKTKVQKFCEDRDWDQYHGAKDLAIAIITEASELLEHFRFKSETEVEALFKDPKKKAEIAEEMADIMFFVSRMAQKYDITLSKELFDKIEKNNARYPVDKSKGSNKKYTELD